MEEKAARPDPVRAASRAILDRAREIGLRFNVASLAPQLQACEKLLGRDEYIDVAVLGQFKAGKSSFINSLIGREVLPTGVIPVTTVITRLYYDQEPGAVVTRFDGSTVRAPLDEIGDYISEEKNPANEKDVEVVDIGLPALRRYPGLRLVDTPGLGSALRHNTGTSRRWLPEAGAAIAAVSAERPLSESDIDLVRELTGHSPNVILLLTKADLLSPEQQAEVIAFFNKTLLREIGRELPVYTYSTVSRTGLLKGRIDALLRALSDNRREEQKSILLHKVASLARTSIGYLDLALLASLKADGEREAARKLILTEKLNYELVRAELFAVARENERETRGVIAARLESKRPDLTRRLVGTLAAEMPAWKGNLWKLTRRYEEWLEETLTSELTALSQKEHRHFFGTLDKARASIFRSLDLFRNLLDRNIEAVLGVTLTPPAWEIGVAEPAHPDIAFMKIFDFHLDALWFVIPMSLFRPVFERRFLRKVPQIVQMHLSRLAYQWEVRINRTIDEMRDRGLEYVRDQLSDIDALLSQSTGRSAELREAIGDLRDNLRQLAGGIDLARRLR